MALRRDPVNLGQQYRALRKLQEELSEGIREVTTWHRWLENAERRGSHQPALVDFLPSLRYLATAHELLGELVSAELRVAAGYSSWTQLGRVLHVTRQAAQQMARAGRRYYPDVSWLNHLHADLTDALRVVKTAKEKAGIRVRYDTAHEIVEAGWARNEEENAVLIRRLAQFRSRRFAALASAKSAQARREENERRKRAWKAQQRRAEQRGALPGAQAVRPAVARAWKKPPS